MVEGRKRTKAIVVCQPRDYVIRRGPVPRGPRPFIRDRHWPQPGSCAWSCPLFGFLWDESSRFPFFVPTNTFERKKKIWSGTRAETILAQKTNQAPWTSRRLAFQRTPRSDSLSSGHCSTLLLLSLESLLVHVTKRIRPHSMHPFPSSCSSTIFIIILL